MNEPFMYVTRLIHLFSCVTIHLFSYVTLLIDPAHELAIPVYDMPFMYVTGDWFINEPFIYVTRLIDPVHELAIHICDGGLIHGLAIHVCDGWLIDPVHELAIHVCDMINSSILMCDNLSILICGTAQSSSARISHSYMRHD